MIAQDSVLVQFVALVVSASCACASTSAPVDTRRGASPKACPNRSHKVPEMLRGSGGLSRTDNERQLLRFGAEQERVVTVTGVT
jgi:hypothetical protein